MTELRNHLKHVITARRLLRRGERVVVAVSGGVDSMVLLHLLHALAPDRGWKLSVAHFNHQLRGRSSAADERLVQRTARALKLPHDVGRANVQDRARRAGVSVEMAARELRHAFLARCARKRKARVVVLAQHAGDQVELFLMRLLRGAGGEGLSGMKWRSFSPADPQLSLVRPLLDCGKDQLLAHARVAGIVYREDASNASPEFERNWVRTELLPLMGKRHPSVQQTLRRTMTLIQDEAELVNDWACEWLAGRKRAAFVALPAALQRRIIQRQLIESGVEPDFERIELLRDKPGQPVSIAPGERIQCDLTGKVSRVVEAGRQFDSAHRRISLADVKRGRGTVEFHGLAVAWRLIPARKPVLARRRPGVELFDADVIGAGFELGHWQPGDRFQPIGMAAAVKLQDWFTNRKVPAAQRHQRILARTERGEVFWVEGERIGEPAKVTPRTRRLLEWCWKRA